MALPWEAFGELPGSPELNFELLCRGLVQRNYGQFGQLRSRRNQPGVEFHLKLERDCELGVAGRWFGWQCRWYRLPADHSLGVQRRDDILKAINNAKTDIPGLTDFVLCLRELPRRNDLDWYFGLDAGVNLALWADEEIETRLSGPAEVLRGTYFGELVLTPDQLEESRARAIAPVKQRWMPEVHVTTDLEIDIRIGLCRSDAAEELRTEIDRLRRIEAALAPAGETSDEVVAGLARSVVAEVATMSEGLDALAAACETGRSDISRELVEYDATPHMAVPNVRALARYLRSRRSPAALAASTVEADLRYSLKLLASHRSLMTAPVIAVVADAGRGKTQLAAELTSPPSATGTAGVFIRGSELRAGGSLDELATRLPGIAARTFDELLEAVDAAGARASTRIPIVIDGLNDAERPHDWSARLAELVPVLDRYDHLLVIVTSREAVAHDVIPPEALQLSIAWTRVDVREVVDRYFDHYKIDPGSGRLPMGLFSTPLFVRMYCEAVNPERSEHVGADRLPASLFAVFELYLRETAKRLRVRPGHPSLPTGHIERKVAMFGAELWEQGVRDLPFEDARGLLDDPGVTWDDSLLRALEEEGVLFRDSQPGGEDRSAVLFDRFAGYVVADALTRRLTADQLDQELRSPDLWTKMQGPQNERHPLGEDVCANLVGATPRRFSGEQLWRFAPDPLRDRVLVQALDLESEFLDAETVEKLEGVIRAWGTPRPRRRHPFDRLWEVRDGPAHRLNAQFLHDVLGPMEVTDRDLVWTEWIRANADEIEQDIGDSERRWQLSDHRDDVDDLDALSIVWLLTSTSLPVRDRATRALCVYGRPDPGRVFGLASTFLTVNDPYVAERVLAASFGAATAHQMPDPGGPFERALRDWIEDLSDEYVGPSAKHPTSHQLMRQYILGSFELASELHAGALENVDTSPLASAPAPRPIGEGHADYEESDQTIHMDFENYTVGQLYRDRRNYDMRHARYVEGLAEIRGRIWELGWRNAEFSELDRDIARDQWRRDGRPERVERYGKKYAWIAFYELAGRISDLDELPDEGWTGSRGVWPDIDPTFPGDPRRLGFGIPSWADAGPDKPAEWYEDGAVELPEELLAPDSLEGEVGPWIAVEGFLEHRSSASKRRVWAFIRGMIVATEDAPGLQELLQEREYLGNDFVPPAPEDHVTFAGEIPWSHHFRTTAYREDEQAPYVKTVAERWEKPGITVELLGHYHSSIEAHRTVTALGSGFWVPSSTFSTHLGLRQKPVTLDLVGLDGKVVSMTRRAPDGFEGSVLYVRRDLLAEFAAGRQFVQLAWGERVIEFDWSTRPPEWLTDLASRHANLWRRITVVTL